MARYVSYLLDLAAEGDTRILEPSVRFAPDPDRALVPTTAYLWKIVVSEQGDVWVRGLSRGTYALIAAARWDALAANGGALVDQQQLDGKNPTGFQWNSIEDSVRTSLARADRANKASPTDKIETPSKDELAALSSTDAANAEMQRNLRLNDKADASAKASAKTHRQGLTIGFAISAFVILVITAPLVCVYRSRGKDKVAVPTLPNGETVPVTAPP